MPHFLVQFGISYTTNAELKHLADTTIKDDAKREDLMPFREGMISFAGGGPNSRTSQLFIAYDHAGGLGNSPWETPFGEVTNGMENLQKLFSGYGDMPPWGHGPEQGPIRNRGESYITENFPLLDKFLTCTVRRLDDSKSTTLYSSEDEEEQKEEEEHEIEDKVTEEFHKELDDPAGAGGDLSPDNEIKRHGGTRGGPLKLKLPNNLVLSGEKKIINVVGQLSFVIVVALTIVYQCTSRRRNQSSKQAEKRV